MPSQIHFKQKIFTYMIPAHPCQCRFSNFVCKTLCFHAFPKPFQIEDIHIISHTLFLPTPASADSPISCAKLGVFMPSQNHCKQKIFTYIIPAHPCQCRFSNFVCKTWCFHAFPKPFQIEDIHILFLPTPASADSPISCAKLGVFMPSQSHFKQKIFT